MKLQLIVSMGRHRPSLPEDIQQLLDLIKCGKLFALQDWIKSGKRLRAPELHDYRARLLYVTVETGFHSILEELLRVGGWDHDELAQALNWALIRRRKDMSELLLSHGARITDLDFDDVCRTLDLSLMERFLREGGDPGKNNAFARALSDIKARPLLRFYRSFRAEFPALDDQAALALHQAVDQEQVRWTALLVWAGADPMRPVPWNMDDSFPVDPGNSTTAATKAIWRNKPEILKVLHLKPKPQDALQLLHDAGYNGNVELFASLLKSIPRDQLNKTPRGSCEVLEQLVDRWAHRDIWTNSYTGKYDAENLQCVEMMLDAGAHWNPPPDDLRRARRGIKEHEPRYIVQMLRLLLYTPGAADLESVLKLCDSKPFLDKIATTDPQLIQELKQLRKQNKTAVV